MTEMPKVEVHTIKAEVSELTQSDLERYWNETAEELGLVDLMKNATPKLGEGVGKIEVDAETTWFYDDFKPHKIDVMELLRKKTGMPLLDCKVNPLFVEKGKKIYSATDKYAEMLKRNPRLASLRQLFPEIDL